MENTKKTFVEKLLEEIKFADKHMRYNPYVLSVYRHLLEILILSQPENLDHMYDRFDDDFDDAYFWFHKGFRTWDTFSVNIQVEKPKLTKEQSERHEFLREKMKRDNLPKDWLDNEQYVKWHNEKRKLDDIHYDDGRRSIGGHLDMLFWNTIHTDKDGIMYKILKSLMVEIKEDKNGLKEIR